MESIQRMKKREYLEMALKAILSTVILFIAIILFESMIYGILMNNLLKNGKGYEKYSDTTIAYCMKQSDDKYAVVYYNEGNQSPWQCLASERLTKSECESLAVKEVRFEMPGAYEFSMKYPYSSNGTQYIHIAVISILVAGVWAFYIVKFVKIHKDYKQVIEEYNTTKTVKF